MKKLFLLSTAILMSACSNASAPDANAAANAQDAQVEEKPKDEIGHEVLADGIYMLTGPGGNIGVSTGEDGVFVIDDKFDRFGEQIVEEIRGLTDGPIRFVINTHYHGDHTGANAKMKDVGATIVAHDNVRARMGMTFENKIFGRTTEATDPAQWPTVTFSDHMTFHLNGQTLKAIHVPHAHTDGDSIIHMVEADIVHMGDNYFNGMFPYVDVDSGGRLQGMIRAQTQVIDMISDDTQIIPGHGPIASRTDLIGSRDTLQAIHDIVQSGVDEGLSVDQMIEGKVLAEYADLASFIDEANMIRIAYRSITD